LKTEDVVLNF
jgi:hypothetical protein